MVRSIAPIEHPPQGSPLFADTSVAKLLHIPRTGGNARAASLRRAARLGQVVLAPHNTRASMCDGPVVCFLRHPVDRFLSAARRLHYDPVDLIAIKEHSGDTLRGGHELLLRSQTWWIDRDLIELYTTEQLSDVWESIALFFNWEHDPLPEKGTPDRNESVEPLPEIDGRTWDRIANAYEDDMVIWHEAYAYGH